MGLLCLFISWAACGAQTTGTPASGFGSLAGIVQDEQAAPIPGAQLMLKSETTGATLTTVSNAQGAYSFTDLPPGDYTLETGHAGFVTSGALAIHVTGGTIVEMPVKLSRAAAARPQFEAAGVRGLIDPGGYSATTQATAATGLIKGVADIERSGNDAGSAVKPGLPCAMEPALERDAEQKPQSATASVALGEFYLAHGQAAKAVPILEHAHSLDKSGEQTLAPLADAYLQAGQFAAARQMLLSPAVPKKPAIYRLLAQADEGSGKFTEAADAYRLAAAQDPGEENLFGAGYELILAGLPADAERAFISGVQQAPRSIQLLIGLSSAQFVAGHTAASIESLLAAIDLNPADARPYPFLSAAASTTHEHGEQVRAAFERYVRLQPDHALAAYDLALHLLQKSTAIDVTESRRIEGLLKRAILLDPSLADAHYQLGVLYERQQNYAAAAHELENALHLSPGLQEAHYRLAMVYRQTGHMDLSAQELKQFRDAQPAAPVGKAGTGIAIEQFISVLAKPQAKPVAETLCPANPE